MPTKWRFPESFYRLLPNGDLWKGTDLMRERADSASPEYLKPDPSAIAKQNKELEKIVFHKTSN